MRLSKCTVYNDINAWFYEWFSHRLFSGWQSSVHALPFLAQSPLQEHALLGPLRLFSKYIARLSGFLNCLYSRRSNYEVLFEKRKHIWLLEGTEGNFGVSSEDGQTSITLHLFPLISPCFRIGIVCKDGNWILKLDWVQMSQVALRGSVARLL